VAAALAYYALFAFVPAISSIVLIYAWVSDPAQITQQVNSFKQFLPAEVKTILTNQLTTLASSAKGGLGFGAIATLLIALWSASKGAKAIMEALNIINDEEEQRGFIKLNLFALGLTLLGSIVGVLAVATVILVPLAIGIFDFGGVTELLTTAASWLVLLCLFSFFLSFTYRYAPDRKHSKWKWFSTGAIIAAVLFAGASALFAWYANSFGNFNKTYGSFGAIIVLMMWFYISSFVILLGGEINAELDRKKSNVAKLTDRLSETKEKAKIFGAKISDAQDHHRGLWH
jgi:membrane protein